MLIFKAVLLVALAACASTSASTIIATATKINGDSTTPIGSIIWASQNSDSQGKQHLHRHGSPATPGEALEAGTTVHSISAQHSTPAFNYSPYDHQNLSPGRLELVQRTKNSQPTLQGGFQASFLPNLAHRSPQNAYKQNSQSYTPQATNHHQNKALIAGHSSPSYFGNPSNYRTNSEPARGSGPSRTSSFPGPTAGFPPFPKFKASPTTSSGSNYPEHSTETLPKYRSNPGQPYSPHSASLLAAYPQRSNNHPYKNNPYLPAKNIPPSSFSSDFPAVQGFQSHDHPSKKLPGSSSLRTSPEVSEFVKAFENEPVILNTGLDYQAHPSTSGFNYDYSKPTRSSALAHNPGSFSSNLGNYQPELLGIQSSRSTPQIPQYKAASVNGYPPNRHYKPTEGYKQIANQPQFHFTTGNPNVNRPPIVHHSKPFENIRTDVEVIEKKKTTTQSPFESEESDFDQDFKTGGQDFDYSADEESGDPRPSKAPIRDGSYELLSSTSPFSSYDEAFGKYSKLASLEQETPAKRVPPPNDDTSKPVYQSLEEDDSQDADDKSSGEHRSGYTEDREPNASYEQEEEEDEEESRRDERQGRQDGKEERDDDDDETSPYRSFGDDFEREFEESYRRDLPKSDYVHVKEVPEIEETPSESKKHSINRPSRKTSRSSTKQKTRHVLQGDWDQPKKKDTKPKDNYRDNEGHGSKATYKKTKIAEPQLEDSYGYKILRNRGTTRFTKDHDEPGFKDEAPDDKKSRPTAEHRSDVSEISLTSTQKTLTPTIPTNEAPLQSYKPPGFRDWKPSARSSQDQDSYVALTQEIRGIFNPEKSSYHSYQGHPRGTTYSSKAQVPRDLTGI